MKILVVEDDHLVREVAAEMLREGGFEVIEAATAEEGLERCARDIPDLLFTDIRLPGPLTGWDVAERCREMQPELPVVYATGFSRDQARPVPNSVLLHKPYSARQVIDLVGKVATRP